MNICESPHLQMRAPHLYLLLVQRQVQPYMLTVQTSFAGTRSLQLTSHYLLAFLHYCLCPLLSSWQSLSQAATW